MNLETDNKIQKKGITLVIPNPCENIKETKMKNSGIEWIGEIPEDWESIRLKYIYSTTKAKLPKQFYDDKNLTPYLSMDFIRDSINTEPVYAKDGDYCSEEDILILWDGSNAGEIVFNHPAGYAPSTTAILKKTSTQSLPVYDKFYLKALEDDLRRNTNGMGIPHVNGSYLYNSLFLLPPKSTQQRIASYLDKKCSKIEETIQNQQQVIEKLKAYKQSLITEAVTGKVKIENGKACGEYESYKDSGVEWIGKIPSGWEVKKAKYFIKISNGSDPKTEEGDTPVYGSGAESFKTCVEFKEGPTVLIGRKGATLHIPHYIEGNYWNVDTAFDVKTYSEEILLLKFYYYCATAFDYRFYLTSTTLPSMTQTNYGNMYLPVPNTLVQKEIVEFLDNKYDAIDTVIEQKQNLIEKLTEYKKSLIYECVTGKKEI